MSGSFNLDDYVDVAERIRSFYERFPNGRLTTVDFYPLTIGDKSFMVCHAKAYRDPDDALPGDGVAWEPVPGPSQFTRDSELMNAQTAAWGRAIVALGFETKKIASRQEVQARTTTPNGNGDGHAADPHGLQASRADSGVPVSQTIVPFGKHKGKQISDVPRDYWEWWLAQDNQGKFPELRAAVELHLGLGDPAPASELDALPF
jgi:uncharacterized protein (DUF3820 family)